MTLTEPKRGLSGPRWIRKVSAAIQKNGYRRIGFDNSCLRRARTSVLLAEAVVLWLRSEGGGLARASARRDLTRRLRLVLCMRQVSPNGALACPQKRGLALWLRRLGLAHTLLRERIGMSHAHNADRVVKAG